MKQTLYVAINSKRKVYFREARGFKHASTFDRKALMPGDTCEVDAYGSLMIAVGGAR